MGHPTATGDHWGGRIKQPIKRRCANVITRALDQIEAPLPGWGSASRANRGAPPKEAAAPGAVGPDEALLRISDSLEPAPLLNSVGRTCQLLLSRGHFLCADALQLVLQERPALLQWQRAVGPAACWLFGFHVRKVASAQSKNASRFDESLSESSYFGAQPSLPAPVPFSGAVQARGSASIAVTVPLLSLVDSNYDAFVPAAQHNPRIIERLWIIIVTNDVAAYVHARADFP